LKLLKLEEEKKKVKVQKEGYDLAAEEEIIQLHYEQTQA